MKEKILKDIKENDLQSRNKNNEIKNEIIININGKDKQFVR